MTSRKTATGGGQRFGAEPLAESGIATRFPPSAERVAARLALVADTSPGVYYLVAAIIEGILSAIPPAGVDERVH